MSRAERSRFLTLVRHAKSSWKDPLLDDFDRPLNKRGRQNAPSMGRRLAAAGYRPDLIISSPARRARETAQLIAEELAVAEEAPILYEPGIYGANETELLGIIRNFDDSCYEVALVGHNPGLTELASLLAACRIENIVTCGVVRLELDLPAWRQARAQCGRMLFYDYPKNRLFTD